MKRRIMILGAAGRDFHNFNVLFRDDPSREVVAFTATQIPKIEGRRYPPALSGPLYPEGIPIELQADLEELIRSRNIDGVEFAYSDISHQYVGHVAARAMSAGADFVIRGPRDTMLDAPVPVLAITAVRTGCGKSPCTRYCVRALREAGHRVVVVRHPMPYGDLSRQAVQRFGTYEDLDAHECTFEEREEYESHIAEGTVVYAGVDYAAILAQAAAECDVLLWDGGNNDWPFYRPDVWVTITDPLRPGHEASHFPGAVNLRSANIVVINKVETAGSEAVRTVHESISDYNGDAVIHEMRSRVTVEGDADSVKGSRVMCIEDGPTLTHGGMVFGAGQVAAEHYGAAEIVDPRPHAVGSIRETLDKYPHIGKLLPAMGYYPEQVRDLEASVRATDCDVVLVGTPFDLARKLDVDKPTLRVRYEVEDLDTPGLAETVLAKIAEHAGAKSS